MYVRTYVPYDVVEAHASTSNWTRTLLSNHVARTTFEWDVLTLSGLGQSLNSSPVLFSVVTDETLEVETSHSSLRPATWLLSNVSIRTLSLWSENRNCSQHIHTIGQTDHEQIRSRINNNDCRTFRPQFANCVQNVFDKVAMSLYNITCILYIYINSIYAVYMQYMPWNYTNIVALRYILLHMYIYHVLCM